MKNVLVLLFLSLLCEGLLAQNISPAKSVNASKRQLALDAREMEEFEEQFESFINALDSGKEEDITAVKLMIEETMLRKIEQPREAMSTETNKKASDLKTADKSRRQYTDKPARLNAEEAASREERREKYLAQKKKNGQLVNTQAKNTGKGKGATSDDKWTTVRQDIYIQFSAAENPKDRFARARLDKLLSSFYDTLEQDLMKKKKQLAAKK